MSFKENRERTVKVLPVGEGTVRVGIQLGVTMQVGKTGAYIKPSVYIEAPKPENYTLEEYLELLSMYVEEELYERVEQLMEFVQ